MYVCCHFSFIKKYYVTRFIEYILEYIKFY